MMVAMFFGMSRSFGILRAPYSWIANAVLLAQFPLAHSVLLTSQGRRLLARLAPRGTGTTLTTTTFATIAALQVLALFALWSRSGTVWWQAHGAVLAVLVVLYATSWLLLGKSMMDAGLALQTELGWLAMLRGRQPVYPVMPQTGLFRLTRQPIYVSFALTLSERRPPGLRISWSSPSCSRHTAWARRCSRRLGTGGSMVQRSTTMRGAFASWLPPSPAPGSHGGGKVDECLQHKVIRPPDQMPHRVGE